VVRWRDPDLGRDRTTLALGSRDWGFFAEADDGLVPADRHPGEAPWGPGRPVTLHDRFDRTWGIPDRSVAMWPVAALALHDPDAGPLARAEAVCDAICARPLPSWRWPPPGVAVTLLADAAADLYDRHPARQAGVLARAARRHGVEPAVALELASGVGALVAQTTHARLAPADGSPSLNALASADLHTVTPLFLARDRLRLAERLSDPDLPRLWILANGLAHGVPADVMRRVPARSGGPLLDALARLRAAGRAPRRPLPLEVHHDLVDWDGARPAVEHLRAVVTAAAEGRRWLAAVDRGDLEDRVLALGVVALTRPDTAAELARCGPRLVGFDQLRRVAGPAPAGVLDLSDGALKAVCERNGWLLGFASERTQQEVVERATAGADRQGLRAALVGGDDAALAALAALAPDDTSLDAHAFRRKPPSPEAVAVQRLVVAGGREALRRFAGVEAPHRASVAEAIAHRFPHRPRRDLLAEPDAGRLLGAASPVRRPPAAVPLTLDLGV
jgi:hypothetical protein